jgi:hypothetical protein
MQCTHRFLKNKKDNNCNHTYTHRFTLKTQTEKTNNLFRVAPVNLVHRPTSLFTIQYIRSHDIQKNPNPLTELDYNLNSLTIIRKPWVEIPCTTKLPKEKNCPKIWRINPQNGEPNHAKNITNTKHSPTCSFLCIQGSHTFMINNPGQKCPLILYTKRTSQCS